MFTLKLKSHINKLYTHNILSSISFSKLVLRNNITSWKMIKDLSLQCLADLWSSRLPSIEQSLSFSACRHKNGVVIRDKPRLTSFMIRPKINCDIGYRKINSIWACILWHLENLHTWTALYKLSIIDIFKPWFQRKGSNFNFNSISGSDVTWSLNVQRCMLIS